MPETDEIDGILSFDVILIEEVKFERNNGTLVYDVTTAEKRDGNIVATRIDRFAGNTNGTPGKVMSYIEGDNRAVAVSMPERFGKVFGRAWVESFEEVETVEIDGKIHYQNF